MWKKTEAIGMSAEPSLVENMTDQTHKENVKYFKNLGSMITNDARCTRDIKTRVTMAKAAFSKDRTFFTSK
jgi:hypothetical protein